MFTVNNIDDMSDDSKQITIDTVPHDALVQIKISGAFLFGLQSALMAYSENFGNENVIKALQKFKDAKEPPANLEEHILYILVSLVGEVEKAAIDQKLTKKQDVTKEQLASFMGIDINES